MILTKEQILELIDNPKYSAELAEAMESQDTHKLHVTGEGFEAKKIKGLESPVNYDLKKELARPTTTRIYKDIKAQFSKVFRAKGFFRDYEFKDKDLKNDFKEYLEDISGGLSLKQLMNVVWHKAMFEDFNGVFIVELPAVQEGFAEPIVKFKSIDFIHDIFIKGKTVEYIIFKWNRIRLAYLLKNP